MKILLVFAGVIAAVAASGVASAFHRAKLIPDIISTAPKDELMVSYGGVKVLLGNDLSRTDTGSRPDISYRFKNGEFYTLVMTDPDVVGERIPIFGEFFMWVVGNIPGDVRRGDEIMSYFPPFPLPGTGKHRYAFLLYKQPGRLSFSERTSSGFDVTSRFFSSVKSFASKHNLGNPVAGNFFTAEFNLPVLQSRVNNLNPFSR